MKDRSDRAAGRAAQVKRKCRPSCWLHVIVRADEGAGDEIVVDLFPCRRLAAAVFERVASDLDGRHVSTKTVRYERLARCLAFAWVDEAGPEFRWWCRLTGRPWQHVRRALIERVPAQEREELLAQHRMMVERERRRPSSRGAGAYLLVPGAAAAQPHDGRTFQRLAPGIDTAARPDAR